MIRRRGKANRPLDNCIALCVGRLVLLLSNAGTIYSILKATRGLDRQLPLKMQNLVQQCRSQRVIETFYNYMLRMACVLGLFNSCLFLYMAGNNFKPIKHDINLSSWAWHTKNCVFLKSLSLLGKNGLAQGAYVPRGVVGMIVKPNCMNTCN